MGPVPVVRLTRVAVARHTATTSPTPSDVDQRRVRRPSAPVRAQAPVPLGGQGRRKIKIELVKDRIRRHTIFSKRKFGIMKKTHELAMLTGSQVLVVVVSETGHVYTNATRGLQPLITGKEGQAVIQSCLNSPDPPPHYDPSKDERITSRGYEETDKAFQLPSEKPTRGGHRTQSTTSPMDTTTTTTSTSSCCAQTQTTEQDFGMSSEPFETPAGGQDHTEDTATFMDFSKEVEETFQLLSEFLQGPQSPQYTGLAAPSTPTTMAPLFWNTEPYPSTTTYEGCMYNGQWMSMDPQCSS